MATVKIKTPRQQPSSFGLYRTSAGGDESIIVRRKVEEPTDVQHTKSRKLQVQRANLATASKHYATLTPTQKAESRIQMEEVEFQKSHGKTDTKLLKGRQLFISKEIHSLATTGKQLYLPLEVCIILTDEHRVPLEGELWLYYQSDDEWKDSPKANLTPTDWLFTHVPKGQSIYHPYGEAAGYYDPEDAETTFLIDSQLKQYHYHRLYPTELEAGQFRVFPNEDKPPCTLKVHPDDIQHYEAVDDYPHNGVIDYIYNDTRYMSAGSHFYFTLPDELLDPIDWFELHLVYRSTMPVIDERTYIAMGIQREDWIKGTHWNHISNVWKEEIWRYPSEGEPPLDWTKAVLQQHWLNFTLNRYDEPDPSRLEATQFFMLVQGRVA